MPNQEKSPGESSTRSAEIEGRLNLEKCLTALDQRGNAGLQEELLWMYPSRGRDPIFTSSFARRCPVTEIPESRRATPSEMSDEDLS